MEGVSLANLDKRYEKSLFLQLRAATVDTHLEEVEPASHIISDYDDFLDDTKRLVSQIGGYATSGQDKNGRPVVITWELEYVGVFGIDLAPENMDTEMWMAFCKRTPNGCTSECHVEGHKFDLITPSQARQTKKTYTIPVFTKLMRKVYTLRDDIVDPQLCEDVNNFLFQNSFKVKDTHGRWLCTCLKEMTHPLCTYLQFRAEYSGKQCISVIRPPRTVGSKGCILSKKLRHGKTVIDPDSDNPVKQIIPPYTLRDYVDLGEDPDDTGGYLVLDGGEYVIRTTSRGMTNHFMTKKKRTKTDQEYVQTTMIVQTHELDPLDVETCYVIAGAYAAKKCIKIQEREVSPRLPGMVGKEDSAFNVMWFGASWLRRMVPVSIVLYALGITSDRDVCNLIGFDQYASVSADGEVLGMALDTLEVGKYVCLKKATDKTKPFAERLVEGARIVMAGAFRTTKPERELVEHSPVEFFQTRIINKFMSHLKLANPLSVKSTTHKAAVFSCMCTKTLRCMIGLADPDDIDHLGNQKLYGTREYMSHLFITSIRKVMSSHVEFTTKQLVKQKFDITNQTLLNYPRHGVRFGPADNKMKYHLKTGEIMHNNRKFSGICNRIDRTSRFAAKASVQSISSTVESKSKATKVRQIHSSNFGMICPSDTPEGERCGLTTHKALSAMATKALDQRFWPQLRNAIFDVCEGEKTFKTVSGEGLSRLVEFITNRYYPILVDGMVWGYTADPFNVCIRIKKWRDEDYGRIMVSSVFLREQSVLLIRTQSGRLLRPLFNVVAQEGPETDFVIPVSKRVMHALHGSRLQRSKITLKKLFADKTITFADTMEQEGMLIGMDPTQLGKDPRAFLERVCVTHFEIDPSLIFGLRASRLPFPSHNQSPRLTYYIQMKSAAVGWPMLNKLDLSQTTTYELCYPQRSLSLTRTSVYAGCYDSPDTEIAFVMVACLDGYNQEDAVYLNQSSVDLGFGRTHVYKRVAFSESRAKCNMRHGAPPLGTCLGDVVFANPLEHDVEVRPEEAAVFRNMDSFGQLSKGDRVTSGQPLIGAYNVVGHDVFTPLPNGKFSRRIELSKESFARFFKGDPRGTICEIRLRQDDLGLKHVEVFVVSTRLPTVGDKMSQPFQKNSCGSLLRQEDMPIAVGPEGVNGMVPDAVINPHAFPSRMTLSPLIQAIASFNALEEGRALNATAFRDHGTDREQPDNIFNDNMRMGMAPFATCGFINPYTGVPFRDPGSVFYTQFTCGFMDFHRLKHMVIDKIQMARRATRDLQTQQPVAGKRRGGAIRVGEMERDCLLSHGAASALKDALFYRSDAYRAHICTECNRMVYFDHQKREGVCMLCPRGMYSTVKVDLPYAAKALFQELNAMGISIRFGT